MAELDALRASPTPGSAVPISHPSPTVPRGRGRRPVCQFRAAFNVLFTGAAAAAAWSPPRYLISKPHARGGYAAGKGRCVVFNFSGSFLHRTCIPVNIRISTRGML